MLTKNDIKRIRSLKLKKGREKYELFICEGIKNAALALSSDKIEYIDKIYLLKGTEIDIPDQFQGETEIVSNQQMSQISALKSHSPVLLVLKQWPIQLDRISRSLKGRYLYLDNIQDPGNMGTIIRMVDWFGLDGLLLSVGCVDFFHPKVVMASMGSNFYINTIASVDPNLFNTIENSSLLIADGSGKDYRNISFPDNCILAIGNEGHGVSKELQELPHTLISIPGSPDRGAESLNAAMAATLLCSRMLD